jgi:hypothetical protein
MVRAHILLLAAGLVVGAPAAHAQPRAAKKAYELGYRELQAGHYARALAHYKRSYELQPRPRTLFNMAVCEDKLGLTEAAWKRYRTFLAAAEPRDAPYKTKARARLTELGRQLAGTVRVVSTPAGAEVHVDHQKRSSGRTPVKIQLTPGTHHLRLTTANTTAAVRTVQMKPRGRLEVKIQLELASSIAITVSPGDAVVQREGGEEHRGGFRARVSPGVHRFTVRRPGYRPRDLRIRAQRARTHAVHVRLRPKAASGVVVVNAPGEARAHFDEQPAVEVTSSPVALAMGSHKVRVTQPGRIPWSRQLHVSPGERVRLDVTLAPQMSGRRRALGWSAAALGVGAFAGAGFLGVRAIRDVTSTSESRHDRGKRRALLADVGLVVGTAAIITAWRLLRKQPSTARIHRSHPGVER